MLILQIFLVPMFALFLVGAVFIIGVAGVTSPGQDDQSNPPAHHPDEFYPPMHTQPPA